MARIKIKAKPSAQTPEAEGSAGKAVAKKRRTVRRQAPTGMTANGMGIAILGWLVALVLVGVTVQHARSTRQQISRLAQSKPDRADKINADCQARLDALAAEKKAATTEYNDRIELQEKLDFDIKTLKLALGELEPQAKSAERSHKQITETVTDLKSDTTLTTESVGELKTRLAELEKQVAEKRAVYKRLEDAMRASFQESKERRDPRFLSHWYATHKHTVFAPAAGVFAAERLYEKKRSKEAVRLYEDILRNFPDESNPYLQHCRTRLQQIQARTPYEDAGLKLQRYAPLAPASAVPDTIH